jgi:hypothetical protein
MKEIQMILLCLESALTVSYVCEVSFPMEPCLAVGLKLAGQSIVGAALMAICAWILANEGNEQEDKLQRVALALLLASSAGMLMSLFVKDENGRCRLQ